MLTRIRNAQKAEHKTVNIPLSKIKVEIASILKKEGYITDFKKTGKGNEKTVEITLKQPAVINEIKRVSKPGQRIYIGAKEIRAVKNGYGISIISTPKGLLTNKEARKSNVGGELLLEIW